MIKEASDGNGGIFKSMAINGCLADMEKRGVKMGIYRKYR